jgi:hypothetical protein
MILPGTFLFTCWNKQWLWLDDKCHEIKIQTLSPVLCIFSVSWSTAILDGAHTNTWPLLCLARWYTTVADVTVLPVPGGPYHTVKALNYFNMPIKSLLKMLKLYSFQYLIYQDRFQGLVTLGSNTRNTNQYKLVNIRLFHNENHQINWLLLY